MRLRGNEFRALVIEPGKVVAFIPSDDQGNKRTGITVRFHDENAAKIAQGWRPGDRIFYYHDSQGTEFEGGFFNERTEERIRVS